MVIIGHRNTNSVASLDILRPVEASYDAKSFLKICKNSFYCFQFRKLVGIEFYGRHPVDKHRLKQNYGDRKKTYRQWLNNLKRLEGLHYNSIILYLAPARRV